MNTTNNIIIDRIDFNICYAITGNYITTITIINEPINIIIRLLEFNLQNIKEIKNKEYVLMYNNDLIYYKSFNDILYTKAITSQIIDLQIQIINNIHSVLEEYKMFPELIDTLEHKESLEDINIFLLIKYVYWSTTDELFKLLPYSYKNNYNFMSKLIKNNPFAIKYASDSIKHDYNINLIALEYNNYKSDILRYISSVVLDDYDIALKLLDVDLMAFEYLSPRVIDILLHSEKYKFIKDY